MLMAKDLPVLDTFQFAGTFLVPSTVSLSVEWEATSAPQNLGSGDAVSPTDPAAFLGRITAARATGRFSGAELGFSFVSDRGANTDLGYAQFGEERNGVFLT